MKHLLRKTLAGILSAAMMFSGVSIVAPNLAYAEEETEIVTDVLDEEVTGTVAVQDEDAGATAAKEEVTETIAEDEELDNGGAGSSAYPLSNGEYREMYLGSNESIALVFKITSPGTYVFFTEGSLDTIGKLYSDEQMTNLMDSDDDSGSGRNFQIEYTSYVNSMTLYLKVTGYQGAAGTFKVWGCKKGSLSFECMGGYDGPETKEKLQGISIAIPTQVPSWLYEITFDAKGGTVSSTSKYVYREFEGWRANSDGTGLFYSPGETYSVDGDTTLYAQWGRAYAGDLPEPTRTGYRFNGWYTSDGTRVTSSSVVDSDLKLHAEWTPDASSNPIYNGTPKDVTLELYGELSFVFTAPSYGVYEFWSEGDIDTVGCLYSDSDMKDQVLKDDDSGEGYNFCMQKYLDAGESIYLYVTGYGSAGGKVRIRVSRCYKMYYTGEPNLPRNQTILYNTLARVDERVLTKQRTVTFDANGGSVTTASKQLPVELDYWKDSEDVIYLIGEQFYVTGDLELTPVWKNPALGTMPTPTRSGYTFAGWYTAASGGTKMTEESLITYNRTLYAHWIQQQPFPFTDVKRSDWYYFTVKEAYESGIMTGKTATTFAPNEKMNRAMVVTVLHRIAGYPKASYQKLFTDVASGQYYTTPVMWAAQNKIVSGYADSTFRPMANVTREQLATMLMNFAKSRGMDVSARADLSVYKDKSMISSYAQAGLSWAVASGILSGTGAGELQPRREATRAEAAKMLLQFYKMMK